MLTGELRSKIDAVWNAFWTGGISNPLEVIEQITYLLFVRGLDDVQLREERKVARFGGALEGGVYPEGNDSRGRAYRDLRWSVFKTRAPAEMFTIVSQRSPRQSTSSTAPSFYQLSSVLSFGKTIKSFSSLIA